MLCIAYVYLEQNNERHSYCIDICLKQKTWHFRKKLMHCVGTNAEGSICTIQTELCRKQKKKMMRNLREMLSH